MTVIGIESFENFFPHPRCVHKYITVVWAKLEFAFLIQYIPVKCFRIYIYIYIYI